MSFIEVTVFNLLPPAMAAPVVILLKDILPLLSIALIRAGLHVIVSLHKFQLTILEKTARKNDINETDIEQQLTALNFSR